MATTTTTIESKGNDARVFDVSIASGDTTGTVSHLLASTPDFANFAPFGANGAGCYSQSLRVTSITATQVVFAKGGGAVASFRLHVGRSYNP